MKYPSSAYARAFAELALAVKSEVAEKKLVKDFWSAVHKNGDLGKAAKITTEAERLLRETDGLNLWEIESARPLKGKAKDILKGIAKPKDIIREIVNPDLVAGVRITKNGEEQLDATLKHRLDTLFQP